MNRRLVSNKHLLEILNNGVHEEAQCRECYFRGPVIALRRPAQTPRAAIGVAILSYAAVAEPLTRVNLSQGGLPMKLQNITI